MRGFRYQSRRRSYHRRVFVLSRSGLPMIFPGRWGVDIAGKIDRYLVKKFKLEDSASLIADGMILEKFPNSETRVAKAASTRVWRRHCVIVQCFFPGSINDALVEILAMASTLAYREAIVTAVLLPYPYQREDLEKDWKLDHPFMAKQVMMWIQVSGIRNLIVLDLHNATITGFAKRDSLHIEHLTAVDLIIRYFKERGIDTVVSPDAGRVKGNKRICVALGAHEAVVDKTRDPHTGEIQGYFVVGNVKGRKCAIIDDIFSTGGTGLQAARKLVEKGATEVFFAVTHPECSGNAWENLAAMPITRFVTTDAIPLEGRCPPELMEKVEVLSVAPILGERIFQIHRHLGGPL